MTNTPQDTPPVPAGRRARRTRRTLAAALVAGAALVAVAAEACSDAAPNGVTSPGARVAAEATDRKGPPGTPWIETGHALGLRAVLGAAGAHPGDPRSSDERCTAVAAAAVAHIADAAAGAVPYVPADVRSYLAGQSPERLADGLRKETCGAAKPLGVSLGDGARSLVAAGRLNASGEALALVDQIDRLIDAQPTAASLDASLVPVEQAAAHLPPSDAQLVWSTAATTRSSAYDAERYCTPSGCTPYGPPPPFPPTDAPTRSEFRAGWGRRVIKADAWGCIAGGIRGWGGGAPGIAGGCFLGGLIGSGGVIFEAMT